MNIELSDEQVKQILKRAEQTVEKEAVQMLRAAVQANMPQWIGELKNAVKTHIAGAVAQDVLKRLDVNGCVDKAMESVNKRIHTEINNRMKNGIRVSFEAVLGQPNEG